MNFEDLFKQTLKRNEYLAKMNYFMFHPEAPIFRLEKKETEVLLKMAIEGIKTGYDLHSGKDSIMSSSTWHYVRSSLLDKGLIELKREEPFRKQKRKRKMYGPTFKGLIVAIQGLGSDEEKEKVRKVAEKWGHMIPLVLGKWNLFVREDLETEAFNVLCETAFWFYKLSAFDEEKNEDQASKFAIQFYKKLLDDYLFFSPSPMSLYLPKDILMKYTDEIEKKKEKSREKWLKCFEKDSEITNLVKILLKEEKAQHEKNIREIETFTAKLLT